MKKSCLGLFIGESFAEISWIDAETRQTIDFQRWYLPRAGLKTYLSKYLQEKSITKLESVFVAHRFLEKLSGYRLGGSVAQVVTEGFEKIIAQEERNAGEFSLWPQRPPAVASEELVFPVNESVSGTGQIEKAFSPEELEPFLTKIKKLEVKRVCLHFHNAHLNSQNMEAAKAVLSDAGFDVFTPVLKTKEAHENPFREWKKNLLEAAISGTFQEMQEEIEEGLAAATSPERIFFLGSQQRWFQKEKESRLGSLVALESLWMKWLPQQVSLPQDFFFFHFGLENFSLIHPTENFWQSPWGVLNEQSPRRQDLRLQPTQGLLINEFGEFGFERKELTFEPGPICLGRGLTPCVYDVLFDPPETEAPIREKLKRSLWALLRTSQKTWNDSSTVAELRDSLISQLSAELCFAAQGPLVVYGFFADHLRPILQSHSYFQNSHWLSEKEWPKSRLVALFGMTEKGPS